METMMNWVKRLTTVIVILYTTVFPHGVLATDIEQDYTDARKAYLSSWISMAAYNGLIGKVAREELKKENWILRKAEISNESGHAKFLIAESADTDLEPLTIVAVTGTSDFTDIKADLSVSKIAWNESDSESMVHRGFKRYATSIWDTTLEDKTVGELIKEKAQNQNFIFTGHSLGGAVSTLLAARAKDEGVTSPLEVITFGAPAIGNENFYKKYEQLLDIKRIVNKGDPVSSVVQKFIGGYKPIGKEVTWNPSPDLHYFKHSMILYIDTALRNYYDTREAYEKMIGYVPVQTDIESSMILAFPPTIEIDGSIQADKKYIKQAMIDYYDGAFPGLVLSEKEFKDLPTALQEAADKKCKYIVTHTLKVVANKNKEQEYILTLGESIYDKHGKLISYQENVTNTKMMTPIEASLYLLILENKYIDTIF